MSTSRRRAQNHKGRARAGVRGTQAAPKAGELAALQVAYKEALEQQAATAEILKVISSSPQDLQRVFDTIARAGTRLVRGRAGGVFRCIDGHIHLMAADVTADQLALLQRSYPIPVDEGSIVGRAIRHAKVMNVGDVRTVTSPRTQAVSQAIGFRAQLTVPMLRDGEAIGAISVVRWEAGRFHDRQVALFKMFADQAVIAVENARLFNETKEALERQTATAEILRVISASPTDVQPVFEAIVESAVRLCGARFGRVYQYDGSQIHMVASRGLSASGLSKVQSVFPRPAADDTIAGRVITTRQPYFVFDIEQDASVPELSRQMIAALGTRSQVTIPMLRAGEPIGAITMGWDEPNGFNEDQYALLQTFADQAVIAIENVRLFHALETRNRDLTEALEQQTATGEILKVISSSRTDVKPVFETVIRNAVRLCDGARGTVFTFDGQSMHIGAHFNIGAAEAEVFRHDYPVAVTADRPSGQAVLERRVVNVPDMLESGYSDATKHRARVSGNRALLAVPMLRASEPLGAIAVTRGEPTQFSESYVALLKTFADQAAIAIENVRLFNELEARNRDLSESLEQQTATAEILQVISASVADSQPVFERILRSCERLFEADHLTILLLGDDGLLHVAAMRGSSVEEVKALFPIPAAGTASELAIRERRPLTYANVLEDPDAPEGLRRLAQRFGRSYATAVAPMFWEGRGIGSILVSRRNLEAFSDKEIGLLRTFADQAVIAIQNARLFREIEEKSRQLEVANKHKSDFLANMSHELRTPLNAIIGFSEALLERMFGELNDKQADYLRDIHESGRHLLSLINDILDLAKIEAGRMELELSTFHLPSAIGNAMTLVRERAQRHEIVLGCEIDPALGELQADERKLKQILLNLLSNAVKFTPDGGRVDVCAKRDTTNVEISVRDTGVGIAPEDQAALFEEFKQVGRDYTRKAEGTGLGLALTKRFVELHGGEIRVQSAPGSGSTFTVSLPLR